jgi:hypothetical protein
MGGNMRLVCFAAVRAVLVPVIVALAWLIWGAAAAEASPLDAGPAGIVSSAASDLVASPAAKPLRAAPIVPGVPNLKAPAATTVSTAAGTVADSADSLIGTATTTLDAVTGAATTVIGEAAAVVTTVTKPAAPVLSEVDKVIDVVEGAVPSVPPVISVPSVPLPNVPAVEPGVAVPGSHPGTGTAPAVTSPRDHAPHAGAADKVKATPALGAGNKSKGTSPTRAAAAQPMGAAGLSLGQLQMTTPHRPEPAGAVQPAPMGVPDATPPQDPLASLAEGPSGSSSSGAGGSGAQAADVAGSWSGMPLGSGTRTHDANQSVPASPAFDPGSSPD